MHTSLMTSIDVGILHPLGYSAHFGHTPFGANITPKRSNVHVCFKGCTVFLSCVGHTFLLFTICPEESPSHMPQAHMSQQEAQHAGGRSSGCDQASHQGWVAIHLQWSTAFRQVH